MCHEILCEEREKKVIVPNEKIVIYHRIMKRENFEVAARDLLNLVYSAQKTSPNMDRVLYVDIDGHRNEEGGFDADMLELQKEYGIGFLLQFVKEINFPLACVKNHNEQNNDIPEKLQIIGAKNQKDKSLEDLYIENYSNTEFVMESDVYDYLRKFSDLLKSYNEWNIGYKKKETGLCNENALMQMWYRHLCELMNEAFNNFIHGNLLSASAMTRTIIECYVYISILLKEQDIRLTEEWFLCGLIRKIKKKKESADELIRIVQMYCANRNYNY